MATHKRQSGMTLTEILVVVTVMAILLGISVPTAQHLMDSFESSTGVRYLINAALSNARAIAVRNQAYAGVRFQEDNNGRTSMIFIVKDEGATGLANGFRAVEGRKPMQLPEDIGIISNLANTNELLWGDANWRNANTFSIVFSPAGKLAAHEVRVRNKDGVTDNASNDTIFNVESNVGLGKAMFYQDDYYKDNLLGNPDLGLGPEPSVQGLIFYDKQELKTNTDSLWSEYFSKYKMEHISPYTGELVMEYREDMP